MAFDGVGVTKSWKPGGWGKGPANQRQIQPDSAIFSLGVENGGGLTRAETAEPVSRDQDFRHERRQGKNHFAFLVFSRPQAEVATIDG